jgi:pimeloyl-ACP methyl ester carboxylesterase
MDYGEYVEAAFADGASFRAHFGDPPDSATTERWTLSREMTARVSWRPYMYDLRLPHRLADVQTPTLLVWGQDDGVVPQSAAEGYSQALPHARLIALPQCGHAVDLEQPAKLADLVAAHASTIDRSGTE